MSGLSEFEKGLVALVAVWFILGCLFPVVFLVAPALYGVYLLIAGSSAIINRLHIKRPSTSS